MYNIKEEGESPEFQAEDHQTGKYSLPLELEENEFDNLDDAYRFAKGIVMSGENSSEDVLNRLLEK